MSAKTAPPIRIAVDIGGTFTDLQIYDERNGALTSLKTPTTPGGPLHRPHGGREGGGGGVQVPVVRHRLPPARHDDCHQRRSGAEIRPWRPGDDGAVRRRRRDRRHYRREVYALNPQVPPVLVPRDRRLGIAERIRADGSIETPLTQAALDDLVCAPRRGGRADSGRVPDQCLPQRRTRAAHRRSSRKVRPNLRVSCSSSLNAEIREYERTSTTILNALLMPVVAGYLDKLARRMRDENCTPRLFLVQSNGGVCSPRRRRPSRFGSCSRGHRVAQPRARCWTLAQRAQHRGRRHGRYQLRRVGGARGQDQSRDAGRDRPHAGAAAHGRNQHDRCGWRQSREGAGWRTPDHGARERGGRAQARPATDAAARNPR